jgi:hypothetical protein
VIRLSECWRSRSRSRACRRDVFEYSVTIGCRRWRCGRSTNGRAGLLRGCLSPFPRLCSLMRPGEHACGPLCGSHGTCEAECRVRAGRVKGERGWPRLRQFPRVRAACCRTPLRYRTPSRWTVTGT